MFKLTVWNVNGTTQEIRDAYTFATHAELHRMLDAYGVRCLYSSTNGSFTEMGIRCEWEEVAEESAPEIVAGQPVRTRKHARCDGTGTITLASGAPATCMGCSGTGRISAYTSAQRTWLKHRAQRHMSAQKAVKAYAASIAHRVDNVEYMAASGLDYLMMREPHRMEKLYASVEGGRVSDVVRALCAYRAALDV